MATETIKTGKLVEPVLKTVCEIAAALMMLAGVKCISDGITDYAIFYVVTAIAIIELYRILQHTLSLLAYAYQSCRSYPELCLL